MQRNEKLEREVVAMSDLQRDELIALWQKQYGCPPPKGIKRGLLARSATWQLQTKRLGGLSPDTRRVMHRLIVAKAAVVAKSNGPIVDANERETSAKPRAIDRRPAILARKQLEPGARLVREWNGRTHIVEVISTGFVHDGKTYGSLSAIARRITGTRWSGPRFFGL